MSARSCSQFQEVDGWLEREPTGPEKAHLQSCADCRDLLEDLRAIAAAAPLAQLDGDPPERLWLALRTDLVNEGLIREAAPARRRGLGALIEEIFEAVPRPAIAGAYVAALIALSLTFVG